MELIPMTVENGADYKHCVVGFKKFLDSDFKVKMAVKVISMDKAIKMFDHSIAHAFEHQVIDQLAAEGFTIIDKFDFHMSQFEIPMDIGPADEPEEETE